MEINLWHTGVVIALAYTLYMNILDFKKLIKAMSAKNKQQPTAIQDIIKKTLQSTGLQLDESGYEALSSRIANEVEYKLLDMFFTELRNAGVIKIEDALGLNHAAIILEMKGQPPFRFNKTFENRSPSDATLQALIFMSVESITRTILNLNSLSEIKKTDQMSTENQQQPIAHYLSARMQDVWKDKPDYEQVITNVIDSLENFSLDLKVPEKDIAARIFPEGVGPKSLLEMKSLLPYATIGMDIGQQALGAYAAVSDPTDKSNRVLTDVLAEISRMPEAPKEMHMLALVSGIVSRVLDISVMESTCLVTAKMIERKRGGNAVFTEPAPAGPNIEQPAKGLPGTEKENDVATTEPKDSKKEPAIPADPNDASFFMNEFKKLDHEIANSDTKTSGESAKASNEELNKLKGDKPKEVKSPEPKNKTVAEKDSKNASKNK